MNPIVSRSGLFAESDDPVTIFRAAGDQPGQQILADHTVADNNQGLFHIHLWASVYFGFIQARYPAELARYRG